MVGRSTDLSVGEQIVDQAGNALLGLVEKWQRLGKPTTYTVASLPTSAKVGTPAYATDCRVFNGTGTRETAGNGTGSAVTWNGSNWVIAGTNVTAAA